jgi:hypothetical protein
VVEQGRHRDPAAVAISGADRQRSPPDVRQGRPPSGRLGHGARVYRFDGGVRRVRHVRRATLRRATCDARVDHSSRSRNFPMPI